MNVVQQKLLIRNKHKKGEDVKPGLSTSGLDNRLDFGLDCSYPEFSPISQHSENFICDFVLYHIKDKDLGKHSV